MRKSILTFAALIVAIAAQLTTAVQATEDPELAQELLEFLKGRQAIYNKDPNASAKVFDQMWLKEDNIVLVSEEFHTRFHGRQEVTPYFNPPKPNLYAYREIVSNPRATWLAEDIATVTYDLRYDMQPIGKPPMGGMSHMMTLLRKTDAGWKIQAELQLPMGLISQSRILQEMAVSSDFVEFARTQDPDYDEKIKNDKRLQMRKKGVIPWMLGGTSQPTLPSKESDAGSGGD
jgi:hypothetical protein